MAETLPRPFGRYQLHALLGHGGMGRVYRASLDGPGGFQKVVAIKVIREDVEARTGSLRRALFREARLGAMLSHPNVVSTWELGEEDGVPFIAMEYVDGAPLETLLRVCGPCPGPVALALGGQIAEGLAAAHALAEDGKSLELVHRDLKPGNVFITRDGTAKIADFGLARLGVHARTTAPQTAKGTPAYMAPEQLAGGAIDQRVDVFALGAVLYELVTGSSLFSRPSIMATLAAISQADATVERAPMNTVESSVPGLEEIIRRCLRADPTTRWESAQAVSDQLAVLIARSEPADTKAWLEPALANWDLTGAPGAGRDSDETMASDLATSEHPTMSRPGLPPEPANLPAHTPGLTLPSPVQTRAFPPRSRRVKPWPWVVGGLGLVLLGILVVLARPLFRGAEAPASESSAETQDVAPDQPASGEEASAEAASDAPPTEPATFEPVALEPVPVAPAEPEPAPAARDPKPEVKPAPQPAAAKPAPDPVPSTSGAMRLLTPHRAARPGQSLRFAVAVPGERTHATLLVRFDGDASWRSIQMAPEGGGTHAIEVAIPEDASGLLRYRIQGESDGSRRNLGTESAHYRIPIH